jgi:hypothetical protein
MNDPIVVVGERPIDQFRLDILEVFIELNRRIDATLDALIENKALSEGQVAEIRQKKLSADYFAQKIGIP